MKKVYMIFTSLSVMLILGFSLNFKKENLEGEKMEENLNIETIILGSGCFWCTEAIFQKLDGVNSVVSGYSGGSVVNPTYKEVCTGSTGHAEVIQVEFDSTKISLVEILEVFWKTHDPTTLNRQGNDVGTQYRSAIFYHNDHQKEVAEDLKKKLLEANIYDNPIVTEITKFTNFYPAEDYHQNYYNQNKREPYCNFVITPKVEKFKKVFQDKLKN